MWFDRWFRQADLLRWFGQVKSALLSLCFRDGGQPYSGRGGAQRLSFRRNSPAVSDSASSRLSLEDVRSFFDEADAEGTAVLLSNCRHSARSANPVAAVALDGVAEQGSFRSCVCDIGAQGFLDADQRLTL